MASLAALAELHARHGHLQEVILQNFVPHESYYGREPAEIADAAAAEYWRTGVGHGPQRDAPAWACPVSLEDMKRLIAEARRLMPDVGIQVPPNLSDWWPELVARRRDRPRRPERQRRPHLARASRSRRPTQVRKRLADDGFALSERLCVYPEYIDPEWVAAPVLDVITSRVLVVHPAARQRPPRRADGRRRRAPRGRSSAPATGTRSRPRS